MSSGPQTGGLPRHGQARGIALMLAAILVFTLMDATAKHLTQSYHAVIVVWARFAVNLAIMAVLLRGALPGQLRTARPAVQFSRGIAQLTAISLFFISLGYIGLAEATAIMDVNPVLITLGAALFLGERIGPRRIAGVAVALIGSLIIIRPGLGVFQPAALLPLGSAFAYAAAALLTRQARFDSTRTSILWSALIGFTLSSAALPFFWQPIALADLPWFVVLGVFGTAAQALLIQAFRHAEAGVLAPFGYIGLILAGLWGWLFWGDLPDLPTVIGAVLIVGAGLYIWYRETRAAGQD